jgi:hypothetical protein
MTDPRKRLFPALALAAALLGPAAAGAASPGSVLLAASSRADSLPPFVLLSWNDLGMHCMNQNHANLSVLPPYNNLDAQLIRRGDASRLPQLTTSQVTVGYSIPGNTYSVGKTDFWTYAYQLFGVTLPPNVGLTGRGLTGTFDLTGPRFRAEGIPLTPFPDATPTVESPYQLALVVARDANGTELARSTPVVPVSVELSCVSAGCHASESAILNGHEREAGFDPNARPVLCAKCHADPVLGTTGIREAGYFSLRMHEKHDFMDQQLTGTALCYKCHPGQNARCLRGVMADKHGMVCQDCHGGMAQMASSIQQGRTPWLKEPSCGGCHTAAFAEPAGQLFRQSTGHGGVMCEACHNSTHAEWPSARAEDNANVIALQGSAGPLSDCRVCHGTVPSGPGPHGLLATADVPREIIGGAAPMAVSPNPARLGCTVDFGARSSEGGRLMVFDAQGRAVRLLAPRSSGNGRLRAAWDGTDQFGRRADPGVYFVRWLNGTERAGARVTVVR